MKVTNIENLTADNLSALKNGTHYFDYRFPDGRIDFLTVHIWHARKKLRHAHFDVFSTPWAFREPDGRGRQPAILRVTARREDFGAAMYDSVGSLRDKLIRYSLFY